MLAPLLAACLAQAAAPASPAPVGGADVGQVATLPLASPDAALDVAGQAIAARAMGTRLTVSVAVDGAGPFRFLVDTGADGSVVGERLAGLLRLPSRGCLRLHGTAGTTLVPAVHIGSLRVGDRVTENIVAPVLPEAALDADGVLGIDALAGQRVKLDFEARSITLEDASRREVVPRGEVGDIVVTARRRRKQLILAAASSAGIRLVAVVDTGANVTVGNGALKAQLFGRRSKLQSHPVTLTSVTGQTVVADLVVVPQIDIGGLSLHDLPIAFADVPPFALFGLADTPAVLLGTDVLQEFSRVSLDFRRRRIRFSLRRPETGPAPGPVRR